MSIYSQNLPGSNKIWIGPSCAFTLPRSEFWSTSEDSQFLGEYTPGVGLSGWTEEENTGVTLDDTSHLRITSSTSEALKLHSSSVPKDLDSPSHITLSTYVENLDSLGVGSSISVVLGYETGAKDVSIVATISRTLAGLELSLLQTSDSDGFGYRQDQYTNPTILSSSQDRTKLELSIFNRPDINLLVSILKVDSLVAITTGNLAIAQAHNEAADTASIYDLYVRVVTTSDVVVRLNSLLHQPVLISTQPSFLPYCSNTAQGVCYFRDVARHLYSGGVMTQQLILAGAGEFYGTIYPTTFDVEFDPEVPSLNAEFATSLCDAPRTNIETCSVCPLEASPGDSNRGAQVLTNICFCDGSAANVDALELEIDLKGAPQKYRREIGQQDLGFFVSEGYYQDRNLKRIHAPDPSLDSATQVYSEVRCLALANEARLYYGLRFDENISGLAFPELTYNFSEIQTTAGMGPLDPVFDEFSWELLGEDGTSIQTPFNPVIDKDNYLDVGNVPTFEALSPGRYKLRLKVLSGLFTQDTPIYARGASLYGKIYSGTTSADPLVASGFAKGYNILGLDVDDRRQQGWHDIHFEIYPSVGAITVWYYNPCSDTITKVEDIADLAIMGGRSISAVEQGDGKIAIYYKNFIGNSYYEDSLDKQLGVRIFNPQTLTFDGTANLYISSDGQGLNCFDVVRLGDETVFYLSMFDDLSDETTQGVDHSIFVADLTAGYPFSPLSQKFGLVRVKAKDLLLTDGSLGTIQLKDGEPLKLGAVEEYLSLKYAEVFVDDNVGNETKLFQPSTIRANSDGDRITLSMIDVNTRFPVVAIDSTLSQPVVVALPNFFDMYNTFRNMQRPNYIEVDRSTAFANVESLDTVMGYDNMLYSFATRGQIVEMAVLDPSPFFEASIIYTKTITNDSLNILERYKPRFAPENYTILSKGIQEDVDHPFRIGACQHMNYTVLTLATPEFGTPLFYQSGSPSQNPHMCSLEMDWVPEFGAYGDWILLNGVLDSGRMALQNLASGGASISLTMDDSTVLRHNHLYLDRGYRFYARMSFGGALTDPAYFNVFAIVDGDPTYRRADCRWVLMGTTAEAQYYDYDAAEWVSVQTWALVGGEVYDFHILMRNTGPTRNIATFQICRTSHCNDLHNMDFRETTIARTFTSSIVGTSFEAVEEGGLSILYPSNGSSDLAEYVYVHHMGWGFLKYWEGNFLEEVGSKGGFPYTFYIPQQPNSRQGRATSFDDTPALAANQDRSGYLYKPRSTSSQSARFHWYNGFSTAFLSSQAGWKEDTFTLMREEASSIGSVSKLKLHGLFSAPATEDPTYVFFDAEDANLDVIYANSVFIKDQNFRFCYIVGRQGELDDWTILDSLSTEEAVMTGSFDTIGTDRGVFYMDGELVPSSPTSYNSISSERWIATSEKAFKVYDIDLTSGAIYFYLGEEPTAPSTFTGHVSLFSGEPVCKKIHPQGWRYFGIMVPPQPLASSNISLGTLDIAYRSTLPTSMGASDGSNRVRTSKFNTVPMFEHQPRASVWKIDAKSMSLTYSLIDAPSALMLMSLVEESSMNRRPIWVCYEGSSRDCHLMLISGSPTMNYIKGDGNQESHYTITLSLNGVD